MVMYCLSCSSPASVYALVEGVRIECASCGAAEANGVRNGKCRGWGNFPSHRVGSVRDEELPEHGPVSEREHYNESERERAARHRRKMGIVERVRREA